MRAEQIANPYIKGVYGSGIYTLEVSAMVRATETGQVWLERQTYQGTDVNSAKKMFRQHMIENGYVLVND
jgi:hypothetical protein